MFTNSPRDWGSIPGQVIPKTQKMVLDSALLNTQHYKIRIKGKEVQSWERSSALPPLHISVIANEKGTFEFLSSTTVANFTFRVQCNPDIREILYCPKLEPVLPKQNIPNPDIRDLVSDLNNSLISGLHCNIRSRVHCTLIFTFLCVVLVLICFISI